MTATEILHPQPPNWNLATSGAGHVSGTFPRLIPPQSEDTARTEAQSEGQSPTGKTVSQDCKGRADKPVGLSRRISTTQHAPAKTLGLSGEPEAAEAMVDAIMEPESQAAGRIAYVDVNMGQELEAAEGTADVNPNPYRVPSPDLTPPERQSNMGQELQAAEGTVDVNPDPYRVPSPDCTPPERQSSTPVSAPI